MYDIVPFKINHVPLSIYNPFAKGVSVDNYIGFYHAFPIPLV